MIRRTVLLQGVCLILVSATLSPPSQAAEVLTAASTVRGVVMNAEGPVAGARVRVRATDNLTATGPDGGFTLTGIEPGVPVSVTAWSPEHYVAEVEAVAPAADLVLTLSRYPAVDNPDYPWMDPHRADSPPGVDTGCDRCHASVIVAQWERNAHARAASDPRVLSVYSGTDLEGAKVVVPGYKLDFPGTAGNCATCHAPGAAANAPFTADLSRLSGAAAKGVFCDLCHKTAGVFLDRETGLPFPNMPGVLSLDLRRPGSERQVFFGPYDDVPDPDSFLPLVKKSQFCAPCHAFSFWGTPIYQSFAEWLASPYAAEGIECQGCHMTPDGATTNFAPGAGGFERDPATIPSHLQPGADDAALLRGCVAVTLEAEELDDRLTVRVEVANTGAGHHLPTGYPGRQMILTVTARDSEGRALRPLVGTTVPDWGGEQAGQAGKVYAKLLRDAATGEMPVVSYWRKTLVACDNRIPARERDVSLYAFPRPDEGTVTITAELRFRRAFRGLMDDKGWTDPDIVMAELRATVGGPSP